MTDILGLHKKVLFIDDDYEDQEIFGEVLSEVDASVNCWYASTAEEALNTLAKTPEEAPDFIFLDLNLPFMSGFECLNAIKKQPFLENIPVIIYSTSSRDCDKKMAQALGAASYISKPNSVSELKSALTGFFV